MPNKVNILKENKYRKSLLYIKSTCVCSLICTLFFFLWWGGSWNVTLLYYFDLYWKTCFHIREIVTRKFLGIWPIRITRITRKYRKTFHRIKITPTPPCSKHSCHNGTVLTCISYNYYNSLITHHIKHSQPLSHWCSVSWELSLVFLFFLTKFQP